MRPRTPRGSPPPRPSRIATRSSPAPCSPVERRIGAVRARHMPGITASMTMDGSWYLVPASRSRFRSPLSWELLAEQHSDCAPIAERIRALRAAGRTEVQAALADVFWDALLPDGSIVCLESASDDEPASVSCPELANDTTIGFLASELGFERLTVRWRCRRTHGWRPIRSFRLRWLGASVSAGQTRTAYAMPRCWGLIHRPTPDPDRCRSHRPRD